MSSRIFRLIAWVSISFLLAFEGLGWWQIITHAGERNNADFMAFYAGGRIAQAQGFSQVYDVTLQQKVEQNVLAIHLPEGRALLYNHMPYLLPILAWIVDKDYAASFIRWALILIVIYIAAIVVLVNALFKGTEKSLKGIIGFSTLTFFPLFVSLWQGQDTAILFLGVVVWYLGILRKLDWMAGIGLALTTVLPHISIILAIPFLFSQRTIWWRFIFIAALLAILSSLLIGWHGIFGFLNLLEISSAGEWFGMNPSSMVNLYGIIVRSMSFLKPSVLSLISWMIYFLGITGSVILWLHWKASKELLLGLLILLTILSVPHLQYHDLALLAFPLLFFVKQKMESGASSAWILLIVGASYFLLAGFLFSPLQFVVPYILMTGLVWALAGIKNPFLSRELQ